MMEQCKCSTKIRNLTVRKGSDVLLNGVSLNINHGEIMALIGRNGAGKTTLLKALLGRIPYSGEISFSDSKGNPVAKPHIGYVPQNLVFDRTTPVTVADMLCANQKGAPVWFHHSGRRLENAASLLKKVGARPDILHKRLGSLSGGELQRVLLSFALMPRPDLLLLDEPVSAVDRKGIEAFYELVTSMRQEYHMPVLLVSHDLAHVEKYATRAALLDRTVLVCGSVDDVMASREVRETFGLPKGGGGAWR